MKNVHAVPLLIRAAESGVREAVNSALVGLADYPGVGREVLMDWIQRVLNGVNHSFSGKYGIHRLCN